MDILLSPLRAHEPVQRLLASLEKGGITQAHGVPEGAKAPLAAVVAQKETVLLITYNDRQALRLYEDLLTLLPQGQVAHFPAREMSLYRVAAESRELTARRIDALMRAQAGELRVLVAPVEALLMPLMPAALFAEATLSLHPSDVIDMGVLLRKLAFAGYERVDIVEGRGQFAARGGIVDLFPMGGASACRIEFFDDEIDTLRAFDVMTQRSSEREEVLLVPPASEALLAQGFTDGAAERFRQELGVRQKLWDEEEGEGKEVVDFSTFFDNGDEIESPFETASRAPRLRLKSAKGGKLREFADRLDAGERFEGIESVLPFLYETAGDILDYLSAPTVLLDEPGHLKERCDNIALEFAEQLTDALERGDALPLQAELLGQYAHLLARIDKRPCMALMQLNLSASLKFRQSIDLKARGASDFHGQMAQLAQEVGFQREKKRRVLMLSGGVARGLRLEETLRKHGVETTFTQDPNRQLEQGEAAITPWTLSHGFELLEGGLYVVGDTEIYGSATRKRAGGRRRTAGQKIQAFTDLSPGDYIVHESHGVGVYVGTVRMEVEGRYRDYLHLKYNGGDKLYVPTDQLDRVQKYIGKEDNAPRLNRLGGSEWGRLKQKVKQSVQDMAQELVDLYAQRHDEKGFAFSKDAPWQREFEDRFPHEETPDQLQSIQEIKRDMERTRAMDRLLCGDVGYGKTEVAMRAAFKAVMDSKQVAILVPTTVLAQQHLQSFQKRFAEYPIDIEMLSRFRTAAQQKEALKKLVAGDVDIIIGTHRLLGRDVHFKDLGLLVVDEEQRFGVTHKEKLKKMKANVDVLTLSATPIPRTLHMSMAGIRDMSLIETPPEERYPVKTYVTEYEDALVRDAITRELARGGQTYVVYNKVKSIEKYKAHLNELVPDAKIAIGHGQMRENELEDVMIDFFEGRYDVLLCSTIIESGLDVPNCNTMVVLEADHFGLSQLYQLRGRVGRSNRLAYCYLTVKANKVLSEIAERRLSAIREFTEFGSGFKIAMRDLEIRGAGNILGAEQHGHMAAVGYDLYVKMMDEAVRKLRGERGLGDVETTVDLRINAFLPEDYVKGDGVRLEVYKRIASIEGKVDRDDVIEELIDRFGDVPDPVYNLVVISYVKALCRALQVEQVTMRKDQLIMRFIEVPTLSPLQLMEGLMGQEALMLSATQPPALVLRSRGEAEDLLKELIVPLEVLNEKLEKMQETQSA